VGKWALVKSAGLFINSQRIENGVEFFAE
jgi:hypothetical protein